MIEYGKPLAFFFRIVSTCCLVSCSNVVLQQDTAVRHQVKTSSSTSLLSRVFKSSEKEKGVPILDIPTMMSLLSPPQNRQSEFTSALKDYVYASDPSYGYSEIGKEKGEGFTVYLLRMDSQSWRNEAEVTPSVWRHWVKVIVPDVQKTSYAHLIIAGGSMSTTLPDDDNVTLFAPVALYTGSPVVIVSQVPGQPLKFSDRALPLREDGLVAYSWRKMMDTGDLTWAAYLPMTKAAARAMDTAETFLQNLSGKKPSGFIVTGFSKRGATAWLTAAVDDRVRAVVPGVFNVLHMEQQIENQFRNYGTYAKAVGYYESEGILQDFRSPEGRRLTALVDPIYYSDKLTMPHYLFQAAGDQFFLPDASRLFVDEIPGEVMQYIAPNEDHGLTHHLKANMASLIAWYQMVLQDKPRPKIVETVKSDGVLEVSSDQSPTQVLLWQAQSTPGVRDFRFETIGAAWKSSPLKAEEDGVYRVSIPEPVQGYTAYFVELNYPGTAELPQRYTTSAYVTPDTRPFVFQEVIREPKSADYWYAQVTSFTDFTKNELHAFLPIRVMGASIRDVFGLQSVLIPSKNSVEQARRQCVAARLNVEAKKVGWHSMIQSVPYWRFIDSAEQRFQQAEFAEAATLCQGLNDLKVIDH